MAAKTTYVAMVAALAASTVWAQQQPAPNPAAATLSLDEVIQKLIAETESFQTDGKGFQSRRPHPAVKQLAPDSAAAVAARLSQNFTGDPLRDTYIRYHLTHVLLTAEDKLPGASLQKFHDALPAESGFKGKSAVQYEPPEIARQYWKLIEECSVTTGFPPFQKRVRPPESFQFMADGQRQAAERKYAQATDLKTKFKANVDKEAQAWNDRLGWLPWMLRQTRGDAMYCMIRSGEPKMLEAAVSLVARNASTNRQLASDYIAFFNAAYFDGWLSQYDKAILKTASLHLKRLVIAGDLNDKGERVQKDSLSELAFTIITAMETGHVPTRPAKGDMERPRPESKALPRGTKVTAATLDLPMIDSAIERALTALDGLRPPDTDLGHQSYALRYVDSYTRQLQLPGHQALATWAMLSAGESPQSPWIQKRLGWTACYESTDTYDRAMRLRALSELADARWQPWIKRDTNWLLSSMTEQGNFNAAYTGGPLTGFGDNANGTYAALGLAGARRAGFEVPDDVWKKIDTYWRNAQFPEKVAGGGGWAVRSYKSLKQGDNPNDFANRVSAPMTAGGLLTLSLTERFLLGPKRAEVGNKLTPEFAAGLNWLDSNFNFDAIDGDSDLFYYLWTIQNVGQATGYRTFNKVDWFREATARLINQQGADGLWKGPKGQTISTSFALLYLYRARGPLAFCKVRFTPEAPATPAAVAAAKSRGPAWNNRPNDLVNLTDEISRQVEVPTSWQIADLDQPAYELAESATLYLATDQAFKLTDAQLTRLREYIDAGGLLIAAPEGGNVAAALRSMKSLANELYPTRELKKVDARHPFYSLNEKVTDNTPMSVIDNGVRPLMVVIEKDIGRDLQIDSRTRRDAFRLMTNIYLYATGRDTKRPRIASNYLQPAAQPGKTIVQAARIKYEGDFNPEPMSLPQLGNLLAGKHGIDLQVQVVTADQLQPQQQVAFITLSDGAKLTADQMAGLKKWVSEGGTLWIDVAGGVGAAANALDPLLVGLGVSRVDFKALTDSPVFTGKTARPGGYDVSKPAYRFFTDGELPSLKCASIADRPAIYLCTGDLSAGLAGANHWGIAGFSVPTTRQLVANGILDLPKPGSFKPAPAATKPTTNPK